MAIVKTPVRRPQKLSMSQACQLESPDTAPVANQAVAALLALDERQVVDPDKSFCKDAHHNHFRETHRRPQLPSSITSLEMNFMWYMSHRHSDPESSK